MQVERQGNEKSNPPANERPRICRLGASRAVVLVAQQKPCLGSVTRKSGRGSVCDEFTIPFDGLLQPFRQINLWFPTNNLSGEGDIRAAALGIILR